MNDTERRVYFDWSARMMGWYDLSYAASGQAVIKTTRDQGLESPLCAPGARRFLSASPDPSPLRLRLALFFGQGRKSGNNIQKLFSDGHLPHLVELGIEFRQSRFDVFFRPLHGG